MRQRMLERINQQFAAFRATLDASAAATVGQRHRGPGELRGARRCTCWSMASRSRCSVRVGASDGTSTEVSGDIRAGDKVIVGAERASGCAVTHRRPRPKRDAGRVIQHA